MELHHMRTWCLLGAMLSLIAVLPGCSLRTTKAATPPPPPPPAAVQPQVPDQPLSVPQTAVELPSPQLVNPEAVPHPEAEQVSVEKPAPAPAQAPQQTPKKSQTSRGEENDVSTPSPAVNEEPPPARFQPILTSDEQKRLQSLIDARRREIDDKKKAALRHPSVQNKSLIERIESFLGLSKQAADQGDLTQADALSERAWILAKELQVE